MSIIKNIGNLPPDFRRTERADKQAEFRRTGEQDTKVAAQNEKPQAGASDKVNLSDTARTLLKREEEVNRYLADLPNVATLNEEDRKDIELKIETGFYDSPEVITYVAAKVANEVDAPKLGLTPARLQEVLENIRSNQYDSDDVLNVVASGILKDINDTKI